MDTYCPARSWRGPRAALVLAALGLLPAAVFAQATAPTPPEQLTGNLTDTITITGTGTTTPSTRMMTLTLQNVQLKLDKPPSGGQVRYVIEQMDTPAISGSWKIGTSTYTEFPLASPGSTPWKGKAITIPWPSSGVVTCGTSSMEQWGLPYRVVVPTANGPVPSPGPPFFLFNVPTDPRAGMGSVMVADTQVQVKYTKQRNTESYAIGNLLNPVSSPTGPYNVTETLTGSFGADGLRAVDIEIPEVNALGLDKQNNGGLVVRHITADEDPVGGDNMAPRLQITLCGSGAPVMLEDPNPNPKDPAVRIYRQPTGGDPLKFNGDNSFGTDSLPIDLYVEGVKASEEMRDIQITASLEEGTVAQVGPNAFAKDQASLTVVSADQPKIQTDRVSNDNSAASYFMATFGTLQLGPRPYSVGFNILSIPDLILGSAVAAANSSTNFVLGYGFEGRTVIHPRGFTYSFVHLKLDRDAQTRFWVSDPGSAACAPLQTGDWKNFFLHIPPGNDTPPADDPLRDDDSQSNDMLYNLDVPGIQVNLSPSPRTYRARGNFKLFATVDFGNGQVVRCSPIATCWVRSSWRQAAMPGQYTWVLATDIPNDNLLTTNIAPGPVSCDLK